MAENERNGFMKKGKLVTLVAIIAVLFVVAKLFTGVSENNGVNIDKNLNGDWKLSFAVQPSDVARTPEDFKKLSDIKTIAAKVPGNVELDLVRAGLAEDPQKGDNVYKFRKYESYQWLYSKKFASPKLEKGQRAILKLDGVDTLADVFVNGKLVGSPENMFIGHEFDITKFLSSGTNKLEIIIRSAVIESKKFDPIAGGGDNERSELVHIRKTPASFGWDIHPRLVTAGLWRSVSLEVRNPIRVKETVFQTLSINPEKKSAYFYAMSVIDAPHSKLDDLKVRMEILDGEKSLFKKEYPALTYTTQPRENVNGVEAWWPRGYGKQPLYDFVVSIIDKNGRVLDNSKKRIGFKTVELKFEELKLPEGVELTVNTSSGNVFGTVEKGAVKGEFKFIINGKPIFMKGTNWVPLDASHSRDVEHTKKSVDMLADLNCNMIRCWGGNVYESEEFYDLCDKYGILVWQDFSMGCSVYPQNADFAEKIKEEVAYIVKRLRSRVCLALWAGNNENDQAYTWKIRHNTGNPNELDKLCREVIPAVIREYDWTLPYIPSSPYLSAKTKSEPKKYAPPEVHMWGPRGYYKAPFYKDAVAVFVSEIGYHGCPNRESLEKMMSKDCVYPWLKNGEFNKEWQAKAVMQYRDGGAGKVRNKLMTKQASILFGECPKDLDDFIFASQVVQGEAKKYFIEMWRSQKFDPKTGILWWNLRDAWPILSDAIVDYYYSKKLAYHYIKRVQTNVCAMINDNLEIVVVNDTFNVSKGKVRVVDVDSGKEIFAGDFTVPSNGKTTLGKVRAPKEQGMFLIEYTVDSGEKQFNHYMYGKPPFKLADYKKWFKALDF